MRAVVQRVKNATLTVNNNVISKIDNGLLVFLGIKKDDTQKDANYLAEKIPKLRIFDDENGKTNLSVLDVGGQVLLVSNFTLYANTKGTNRPDFCYAAGRDIALPMYEYFASVIKEKVPTYLGMFGEDMQIDVHLDGPFTILLDSENKI